jgi:hypothetical protein
MTTGTPIVGATMSADRRVSLRSIRPRVTPPRKIHCTKVADHSWSVSCPCCALGWEAETGKLALQVVGAHVTAHVQLPGRL